MKGDVLMIITKEMIISGFISKVISDIVDISENPIKDAIRNADKKRRDKNQSIETRIYQVTIDAIKEFTKREYKGQDALYDAAESIIRGFIRNRNDKVEAVRMGLKMLGLHVTSETCEEFLKTLCHVICMDENDILYKEIILIQGGQTFEAVRHGFDISNKNDKETHEKLDHMIDGIDNINRKIDETEKCEIKHFEIPVENRAEEYAKKWNENVFLNNFNEEDENAGVNIKLKDIYREECLPHYIWKTNSLSSDKLKNFLNKYIIDKDDKKMLLILGQAGIGKSTLITWIMANLVEKKDDILVYQFANDLGSINWQSENILNRIFTIIGLKYDELENKTLILDGFDEIYAGGNRERILNKLNQDLRRCNTLKAFSLIITCRENYIYNLRNVDCDYIVLQAWNEMQIGIFCRTYWDKCENDIFEDKIRRIQKNKVIFGIPLILYTILALDITIEKSYSIADVYDQIFSLKKGGIYDRCYDTEHRINEPETKKHIHRISQKIAFWIFENNAYKAFISKEKFEEICKNEMNELGGDGEEIQSDTLIGNFFRLKHCEGKGTDELQFVHRSIYEYFVAVYFFESVKDLTSREAVVGKLGELLKKGQLSKQILEFVKYKFDNMERLNLSDVTKEVFNIMLRDGMTYHIEVLCKKVIERERNIFSNMLEVVGLWNSSLGELDEKITIYLQCNREEQLKLRGIQLGAKKSDLERVDLRGAYLRGADLRRADLSGAYLIGADLRRADLRGAYLSGADLRRVDLREAYLRGADLRGAYLIGADLRGAYLSEAYLGEADLRETIFDEKQMNILYKKNDLSKSRVYIIEIDEIISCEEYCIRKQKK